MKKKALSLILALCMVLSLLPATVFAAPAKFGTQTIRTPELTEPAALPELPAETNGNYSITMEVVSGASHGTAELYASSGNMGEYVYLLADPDAGYLAEVEIEYYYSGYEAGIEYALDNLYRIRMSDGDVHVKVKFYKAEGSNHTITVNIQGDPNGGTVTLSQTKAKPNESVFVEITAKQGYTCYHSVRTADGEDVRGAYLDSEDSLRMELLMEEDDLVVTAEFVEIDPYTVNVEIFEGGTATTNKTTAYSKEEIVLTVNTDPGWELTEVICRSGTMTYELTQISENQWSVQMPNRDITFIVRFKKLFYDLNLTVDTGLGGTATLERSSAQVGDTIALMCVPEEGYRVAQITGADGIVDKGSGVYTFTMPPRAVDLHVLFLRNENPFLDVNEKQFFYESVLWAVENGITSGLTDTTFGPYAYCNRAQVVTFLWRAAGSPEPAGNENPFTDVPEKSWYTKAVLWAVENGITNGLTADTFGPNEICNRAQVVTFLWRAHGKTEPASAENPFEDVSGTSFCYKAVLWAVENGITNGTSDTTFNPNGECMRAHVVTFLYRAAQLPAPEPEPEPEPEPDPTDPEEPETTYNFVLKDNGFGKVSYKDGVTSAAPGESIFFYAVPNEGYYLARVEIFNPYNEIDVSQILVYAHDDNLYELVMIDHEIIMTCVFEPIPNT